MVYTLEDGRDTRPVRLDRFTAIEVAMKFRIEGRGDRELKINVAAAKFILEEIQAAGWLEDSEDEQETDEGEITPRHLPRLEPLIEPDVSEDMLGDLVFALSGVKPELRTDPDAIEAGSSLYEQFRTPASRVSASAAMERDHWYVLSHLHPLGQEEFRRQWDMAKEQRGQGAVDYSKLARILGSIELDEAGKMLQNPKNAPLLKEIGDGAVVLLYRQFRTVRRKLDEIHASADSKPKSQRKGLFGRLRKSAPETSLHICDDARKVTQHYLEIVIKLGRILRSELLQSTNPIEANGA